MEKIIPLRERANYKILFLKPRSFEEVEQAIDALQTGIVLLLNLTKFKSQSAQRIADYTAGSACAISAHHIQVSKDVFLIAPERFKIITQL